MFRPGMLRYLDEDASGRSRVNECDEVSTRADSRRFIDHSGAGGLEPRKRRVNVVDAVTDVMDSRTTLGKKLADWRLRTRGLEKLDPRSSDRQHAHVDALIGDGLATVDFEPERVAIERE